MQAACPACGRRPPGQPAAKAAPAVSWGGPPSARRAAQVFFNARPYPAAQAFSKVRPYPAAQVFFKVLTGFRPAVPEGAPPRYATLMTACWSDDADRRPPFDAVLRELQARPAAPAVARAARAAPPRRARCSVVAGRRLLAIPAWRARRAALQCMVARGCACAQSGAHVRLGASVGSIRNLWPERLG